MHGQQRAGQRAQRKLPWAQSVYFSAGMQPCEGREYHGGNGEPDCGNSEGGGAIRVRETNQDGGKRDNDYSDAENKERQGPGRHGALYITPAGDSRNQWSFSGSAGAPGMAITSMPSSFSSPTSWLDAVPRIARSGDSL